MPKHYQALWLPRRGHHSEEYEDAFAANEAAGRFAVADGASEGCFTGLWAKLLVDYFVADSELPTGQWADSLAIPQEQWNAKIHAHSLPWYAEEGANQGAFAAFLGLAFTGTSADSVTWQAVAVGDVCLFHTRPESLLHVFPLDRSEQFNNFPILVGSHTLAEVVRDRQRQWFDGRGQSGDRLWLMTDALASWCMAEIEAQRNPWRELDSILAQSQPEAAFTAWIDLLHDHGRLRNDDVTLMCIEL